MDKEIKEKKRRNAVNIKKNRIIPEHSAGTEANFNGIYHFTEKKRKIYLKHVI